MAITHAQNQELQEVTTSAFATRRTCVPDLEEILYRPFPVLDHGFVRVIDYMGDDSAIVQAARVSYGKGTKQINQDKGLIDYLMRHRHSTPFEMCEIKFHVKLPIFVARQWIRHRTANVNEYSARYSILGKEFYIPNEDHLTAQSTVNHQGRSDEKLSPHDAHNILNILKNDSEQVYRHYEEMLNENETGDAIDPNRPRLARELARMNLTLNYYTEWYWKVDLHNLCHFLALRSDPHAQYEIRVYADVMLDIMARWVPLAFNAFREYRLESASFSKTALSVLKRIINGESVTAETSGMNKREWADFSTILGINTGKH